MQRAYIRAKILDELPLIFPNALNVFVDTVQLYFNRRKRLEEFRDLFAKISDGINSSHSQRRSRSKEFPVGDRDILGLVADAVKQRADSRGNLITATQGMKGLIQQHVEFFWFFQ